MQRTTGVFYLRKRINGEVYRRSLETNVFSVARERIPAKVKEIIDEIEKKGHPDVPVSPAAPITPVMVSDGILKHKSRLAANPFKKLTRSYYVTCEKRLLTIWPGLPKLPISGVTEECAWSGPQRSAVRFQRIILTACCHSSGMSSQHP